MINYIETHLVDHCNLRCRGCSHFSGLAPEQYVSLSSFYNQMKRLSSITEVNTLRLMGGEPLLHPKMVDFFIIARSFFPSSEIVLVSNGTLLKILTDEQIHTLNENNIALCVSDYGLKIDQQQLEKFKIYYFHGKSQMYNISLDLEGKQDNITSFYNCDLACNKWFFLKEGRIYQCCIMANIDFFCNHFDKKIDVDIDDISIDIFNHNEQEILEFLNHPHSVCRYCNTIQRHKNYSNFAISKGDIKEWTI